MSYGIFGEGLRVQAPVKHKVFVSYHHGGDQAYYDAFLSTLSGIQALPRVPGLPRRYESTFAANCMRMWPVSRA